MKRTMYQAARHTPKRGAGSSTLPGDAKSAVNPLIFGAFSFLSRLVLKMDFCFAKFRLKFHLQKFPVRTRTFLSRKEQIAIVFYRWAGAERFHSGKSSFTCPLVSIRLTLKFSVKCVCKSLHIVTAPRFLPKRAIVKP